MRVTALAFLFAPLSWCSLSTSRHPLFLKQLLFPAGSCVLKAFLWKPNGPGPFPTVLFNHGSGGADADHTAGLPMTEAARKACAAVFETWLRISLSIPPRPRAFGRSRAVHARILQQEEAAKGKEARQHLQFLLATTDHLDDVIAALSFQKTAPAIDAKRHCDCRPLVWRSGNIARCRARQHRSCCGDIRGCSRFMANVRLNCASDSEAAAGKTTAPDHADSGGKRLQHCAQSGVGRRTAPSAQTASVKNLSACRSNIETTDTIFSIVAGFTSMGSTIVRSEFLDESRKTIDRGLSLLVRAGDVRCCICDLDKLRVDS